MACLFGKARVEYEENTLKEKIKTFQLKYLITAYVFFLGIFSFLMQRGKKQPFISESFPGSVQFLNHAF